MINFVGFVFMIPLIAIKYWYNLKCQIDAIDTGICFWQ